MIKRSSWVAVASGLLLARGGDSSAPQSSTSPLALDCAGTGPTQLAPGAHVVLGTGAVVTPTVVPRFGVARVR